MSDILKVDLQDNIIGYGTKDECHKTPILHRAFSVFLYSGNKMLIQQRAMHKYHSGGLWTNSCCSHPKKDETIEEAVLNRLGEELGIYCECKECFSFAYYHKFNQSLYEYEVDHVFIGQYSGDVCINEDEAMDYKWIDIDDLLEDVKKKPEKYTVWFITALPKVVEIIKKNKKIENAKLADLEPSQLQVQFKHFPEVIQIELTDRCNSECIMCKHFYEKNDRATDLDDGILEKLEQFLPYTRLVLLNGYGESLISSKYNKCMDLLRKHNVKAFVTTNLSVFDEQHCYDAETVFEQINVSCHGCSKEEYERISLGLDFDVFKENLKKLTSLKKCPKVVLSVVVMACNIKNMPDMVHFAKEYGITEIRFGRLGINSFINNDDLDLIHYPEAAKFYFRKVEELAKEYGVTITYPTNFMGEIQDEEELQKQLHIIDNFNFKYDREFQKQLRHRFIKEYRNGNFCKEVKQESNILMTCHGICDWVAKGMYIDKQGKCYPCCESKKVSFGDLKEDPFNVINSKEAVELRNEFYNGKLPQMCRNCPFAINNELEMLTIDKVNDLYISPEYDLMK